MRAAARLAVAWSDTAARTRVTRLHSDTPLILRPTNPSGAEPMSHWSIDSAPAQVALMSGAAGPLGGDDLRLDIDVGAGASLVLRTIAATLALPGPHGLLSRTETTVRVAADGTLIWLPKPLIAAKNCQHETVTTVMLEPGARFLLREELLLGRHGERPGRVRQHLRICQGGRPLYDQELVLGGADEGWDGPAVLGGRTALGSVLIVDPVLDRGDSGLPSSLLGTDTALFPLSGPALQITSLARDGLALRRRLDSSVARTEETLRRLSRASRGERTRSARDAGAGERAPDAREVVFSES